MEPKRYKKRIVVHKCIRLPEEPTQRPAILFSSPIETKAEHAATAARTKDFISTLFSPVNPNPAPKKTTPASVRTPVQLSVLPGSSTETYANLSDYILAAEATLPDHTPRRTVFRSSSPRLRSDSENRILIYPGSFNPPHYGHLALLCHAFLCTDDHTIAAMFLPMPTSALAMKSKTREDGRTFTLSLHQRRQLLQDEVLGRFTWVFPGHADDITQFMARVQHFAAADGFKVSFPSLHGGDHFDDDEGVTSHTRSHRRMLVPNSPRPVSMAVSYVWLDLTQRKPTLRDQL
jgi:hypothetical protein